MKKRSLTIVILVILLVIIMPLAGVLAVVTGQALEFYGKVDVYLRGVSFNTDQITGWFGMSDYLQKYGIDESQLIDKVGELAKTVSSLETGQAGQHARLAPEEIRKLQALGYVSGSQAPVPVELEVEGTDPKHIMGAFSELMGSGEDALVAGDFEAAAQSFSRIIEMDPGNPQAYAFRAELYCLLRVFRRVRVCTHA